MGFFKTILDHFSSEKQPEIIEVKFNELEDWLNSWSKKKFDQTTSELVEISKEISEEKEKIKENLKLLADGTLKNPNIPEKAKHFMEGNRENYIQKVNLLLGKADLPEDFVDISEFCNSFDKYLDFFNKNTFRSYRVLQEFFANESKDIASSIGKIENLVKKAKQIIKNAKVEKVKLLKNKIKDSYLKINQKDELKQEIELVKEKLEQTNKKVEEKENEVKKLKESKEYDEFKNLINKKETLLKEQDNLEKQLFHSFSVIETALKKYERVALDNQLVKDYLKSSLKTLLKDSELDVVVLFNKMKEAVENGSVELKDKKKVKTLQELSKMDKNYFEKFLENYQNLTERFNKLNSEIDNAEIEKQIQQTKEELKIAKDQTKNFEDKLANMKKEFDSIDIEAFKKSFEVKFKETIGENVVIV